MANVMRKEARHTQRRDRASGVPLDPGVISQSVCPHTSATQLTSTALEPVVISWEMKLRSYTMETYFGHLMRRVDSLEKTLMPGRDWGQEEKGTTEDEMAGWHHQLEGHEFAEEGRRQMEG